MGVKGLWSLLTPFCEKKPLYELQGKVIAIDLACWICEALTVVEYSVQPRFYIRNLFFRTYSLLLLGVQPVFVLDGKAPTLKYDTIAARNQIQFKGAKPKKGPTIVKVAKDRTRFNSVMKQCEELLNIMGIKCVHGWGEAEAMCAYLNADQFVDGCVTQDSDCFVYGAKIVYRNFSLSQQGATANKGGSIDVYDISKVPNLGRNKMVALALLCGCDYNTGGVTGIGIDSAMKFLDNLKDDEILNRMRSWRTDANKYELMEREVNSSDICTSCGHSGKVQKHVRSGCLICGTDKGCLPDYKEKRLLIKNELNIRKKALSCPDDFLNEEIIDEFLVRKGELPASLDLSWVQPNLLAYVKFVGKMVDWPEMYAVEKFLPLLTRWQLLNYQLVNKNATQLKGVLHPKCIKKKCKPKGVFSYEIIWEDKDNYFSGLIPDEQMDEWKQKNKHDSEENFWSTVEPEELVQNAYPTLVQEFLESKMKKKPTKRKKVIQVDLEDLNDSLNRLFVSKKPVQTNVDAFFQKAKPRKTRKELTPTSTDSVAEYINAWKTGILNSMKIPTDSNTRSSASIDSISSSTASKPEVSNKTTSDPVDIIPSSTPLKNKLLTNLKSCEKLATSFDFDNSNLSGFESDNECDLSDIVESIVSKGNLNLLNKFTNSS